MTTEANINLPLKIKISKENIVLDKALNFLDPLQQNFDCDFGERLPCSIREFIYLFKLKYTNYE